MLLSRILCILLFTALEAVNGDSNPTSNTYERAPGFIKSRISQRDPKTKPINDSQLTRHLIPQPNPKETIGDYFDKYATKLDDPRNSTLMKEVPESSLIGRSLIRGPGYLGSIWNDTQESYNISISRCIQFADTVGTWTTTNGTTIENATLEDIIADLRIPFTTAADLSTYLSSRLLDNTAKIESEAEAFLNSTVCDATKFQSVTGASASSSPLPLPEDSALASKEDSLEDAPHDELRKILSTDVGHAPDVKFWVADGYWTAVLLSAGAVGGVGGALYKGFYNPNATDDRTSVVFSVAAALVITRGVIERLYMTGHMRFIEVSIIGAFLAWVRQAVKDAVAHVAELPSNLRQIGSDNHLSGCLEEIVVDNGYGLPSYSNPPAGVIELSPMGACRG